MARVLLAANALAPPPAPTISGAVTIGGTLTITPGAGGGPVSSYTLYRNGVSAGTVVSPYTLLASDMVRALTVKAANAAGTSANSNALSWNPTALVECFDLDLLTPGAIASMTGRKAGVALAQGTGSKQPTASATSFNSRPGLTFAAASSQCLAGAWNLSAFSSLRIVSGMIDTTAALSVAMEHTAATATVNGAFNIVPNLSGTALGADARGTVGFGGRTCTETLASAKYCSFCVDTSIATGVQFIRVNGVAQALTNFSASCGAGNFANSTFNLGARNNGASLPWDGTFGGAIVFMSGTAQDADLTDAEAYVRNLTGL